MQDIRRYTQYPTYFQSAWSIPTSKSPLVLSVANQLFQETVHKRNFWPIDYLQVFLFLFLCVDGLLNKEMFTQNA